ncbi:hypothetical protein [Endozoicomonas acroporae]|nr:hypothetical protein [Endozoicomonas acroporae]
MTIKTDGLDIGKTGNNNARLLFLPEAYAGKARSLSDLRLSYCGCDKLV